MYPALVQRPGVQLGNGVEQSARGNVKPSIYSNTTGGRQGLSLGLLNLAIVVPQIIVSLVSGFVDKIFGGGNLPTSVMGAITSFASGLVALLVHTVHGIYKPGRQG
ncbi:hypothetical protein MLD38_003184 [Melastoma candidum]|uniref:Uncharacterized protein n=1 Tax=Melastoma candidum TaxID=119954 RepID=A0ACB9S1A1_9MYRT|nr:hypothetical protein MLD38_003184 [Melastoma candidum]